MNIISVSIAFNFNRKNCNFSKANIYLFMGYIGKEES